MKLNSSSLVGMKIPWTTGRGAKKYTGEKQGKAGQTEVTLKQIRLSARP